MSIAKYSELLSTAAFTLLDICVHLHLLLTDCENKYICV